MVRGFFPPERGPISHLLTAKLLASRSLEQHHQRTSTLQALRQAAADVGDMPVTYTRHRLLSQIADRLEWHIENPLPDPQDQARPELLPTDATDPPCTTEHNYQTRRAALHRELQQQVASLLSQHKQAKHNLQGILDQLILQVTPALIQSREALTAQPESPLSSSSQSP